jgi:hypothetical protein
MGIVHKRQQIAKLLDREAEIAAAPDEAKALQVGIAVAAVPSRAPTSPRQEPDLLIVPDSRDVTLRSFSKSADRQE